MERIEQATQVLRKEKVLLPEVAANKESNQCLLFKKIIINAVWGHNQVENQDLFIDRCFKAFL